MTPSVRGIRRVPLLLGVALAGGAILFGGPGVRPGEAGDRYRAGEAASVRAPLPARDVARARGRALELAGALGIPSGVGTVNARVTDRFAGTTEDEVVTTDARGRRLGIVRTDAGGRLSLAVRLGWPRNVGAAIDAAAAARRATEVARAAGLSVAGRPHVGRTADRGWRATWPRVEAGVPVMGDGATVTLFADGTFHSAARRERPLAAHPGTILPSGEAKLLARARLADLLGRSAGQARITALRLAWVAPNDTFDGSAPDAPGPILRLAWVAEARAIAPLSDRLRALELYLDAGDGALVGGDLLR